MKIPVIILVIAVGAVVIGSIFFFSRQLGIYSAFFNNSPIIDSYSPSSDNTIEVNEGGMLTFEITASDPDEDVITCGWKLSNKVLFEEALAKNHTTSSWSYYPELGDRGEQHVECIVSDARGGYANLDWTINVRFIELSVMIDNYNLEREWIRDSVTDLPACKLTVSYSVANLGNVIASNVELRAFSNDKTFMEKAVTIDPGGATYTDQFSATLTYDSDTSINLQALCGVSFDSCSFDTSAKLDRRPTSSRTRKLYVTPDDPIVESRVKEILEGRTWWDIRPEWKVIVDWVKEEIEYEYDKVLFGEGYWQLPRETLARRKGDCEDQAILLCSLLRANGYKPDEVYVILGFGEDAGHAWVVFKVVEILGKEFWIYLEPTSAGWGSGTFDWLSQILGLYESEYGSNRVIFNDQVYEKP